MYRIVQGQSNGDLQTILSAGFEAVRAPSPVGPVNTPENLTLTQGTMSGQLKVHLRRNGSNITSFSLQHGESPTGPWIDNLPFTTTRTTIDDLTPGTMYWVRARANGAGGVSEWTPPSCAMALQLS